MMLEFESPTTRITYRHGWTPERVNEWLAGESDEPGARREVGFKVPSEYIDSALLKGPRRRVVKRGSIGRWRWLVGAPKSMFIHGVWECTASAVHMTASPTGWNQGAYHVYVCLMEVHGWYGFKWTGTKYQVVAEIESRGSSYNMWRARLRNRHVLLTVARIAHGRAPREGNHEDYTKDARGAHRLR